ncbi:MAG: 5'/3'-nucleotidase SurE, partial [candidate division GAL15 bacterium]
PNLDARQIGGVQVARQSARRYRSRLEQRTDPRGRPYYMDRGGTHRLPGGARDRQPRLRHGYVSVMPLQMDLTQRQLLAGLAGRGLERLVRRT